MDALKSPLPEGPTSGSRRRSTASSTRRLRACRRRPFGLALRPDNKGPDAAARLFRLRERLVPRRPARVRVRCGAERPCAGVGGAGGGVPPRAENVGAVGCGADEQLGVHLRARRRSKGHPRRGQGVLRLSGGRRRQLRGPSPRRRS